MVILNIWAATILIIAVVYAIGYILDKKLDAIKEELNKNK